MEKKISISQIKEVAQEAYNEVKGSTGGKNADYIPYLANIDSKLFGLSICLMNGQTINIGDTDYRFGIESVSKVHTAILILRQYGAQKVLDMIGADATGLPFNSIITNDYEGDETSQREILTDNYANKQLIDAEDVSFESVSEHHTESEQQTATIDPGY